METVKGELLPEKQQILKSAIRAKIFNQSELMRSNLNADTEFVYSEQYPTQVIDIKGSRYLRINAADIEEESIDDLLSLMLGIDSFKESEDEPIDIEPIIKNSIKENLELDGYDLKDLFEYDEYENITNLDQLPIKPQYVKVPNTDSTEPEEDTTPSEEQELQKDMDSSSCDMSSEAKALQSAMDGDSSESSSEQQTAMQYQADKNIEQALQDVERSTVDSQFKASHSVLSLDDIKALDKKANRLLRAFKGSKGKDKRISPSKRLCSKSVAIDRDKVYYNVIPENGKHIKMNFLIDMSGSMSGKPVKNAVSLVYIFNKLAEQGYLDMKVVYSETRHSYVLPLPAKVPDILALCNTGNSEGLARTVAEHVDILKNTNLICLTDGNIVDEHLKKSFWLKNRIISTGVYVNKSAKDLREYTGSMSKWFLKSGVRHNLDDLIEYLIKTGLK